MASRREPWTLFDQFAAAGLEVPHLDRCGWRFTRGRLFVHLCAVKSCPECRAAQRQGWQTATVTADEITDGRALDRVGALLWRAAQQPGLF